MKNQLSYYQVLSDVLDELNDSNNAINQEECMKKPTNGQLYDLLKEIEVVNANTIELDQGIAVEVEKNYADDSTVAECTTTPTMLEARGIYDVATVITNYAVDESELCEYVEDGITVTKLPTYVPVRECWELEEADYGYRAKYADESMDTNYDGTVVPSTKDLVELELFAKDYLKPRVDYSSSNESASVRARLYQAFEAKNGKTYRTNLNIDLNFDLDAIDPAELVAHIEDGITELGLQFTDALHVVVSGKAVRRLTDTRCEYEDEWQDKLELLDGHTNIYLQVPIITNAENNLYKLIDTIISEGILTGTMFDTTCRIVRGMWEDYLAITREVEARTKLEASRYEVTKKMMSKRRPSSGKKTSYETIAKALSKLPCNDDAKAKLIRSGAVAFDPALIKPAFYYIYSGNAKSFSKSIYFALKDLSAKCCK